MRVRVPYGKKMKRRVQEDIESEYGFQYWKIQDIGKRRYITLATVYRTGINLIRMRVRVREEVENGYEKILIWFPVMEDIKNGYHFPY